MDAGLEEEIALEVESVSYMSAAALNAEGYSHEDSRVFLAGDAAYVMPPTGGIGGNTGIQVNCRLADCLLDSECIRMYGT